MFIALGLGAYSTAVFHVTTHAFFKALLFLGAGSIIHAMDGEQDIRKMGGLRKRMPITYITFLLATLAISGIPPFSGFFSKDLILNKAFESNLIVYALALFGALLTCFYMFRLLYLVFFGQQRLAGANPHESPKVMTIPLMILAVLSVFGGFINIPALFGGDSTFLTYLQTAIFSKSMEELSVTTEIGLIVGSLILLSLVILFAYNTYARKAKVPSGDEVTRSFIGNIVYHKFYIDEVYAFVFEKPFGFLSDFFFNKIENKVIDPIVDGVGTISLKLGNITRTLQQGNISFYLFAMVLGILLFIGFILII
jgi:NADH-quinone oxidoreductase subunit L